MDIVVFGAGSLGSLIGGLLAREHRVILVGRDPHVSAVREDGLRIAGEIEADVFPEATTDGAHLVADLACVTVKSYDTAEAARTLATGEYGTVLSLQNGMGNEEHLAAELDTPVLAGTATYGAVLREPGFVTCTGLGEVVLGAPKGGESNLAGRVDGAFSDAGVACSVATDMSRRRWEKCAVNAAINPVTALVGIENGAILDEPAWSIAAGTARETARVAREADVDLSDERVLDVLARIARDTAPNTSSMAQDIERGHRTEIDAINGYVVDHADEPVPINATLAGLVKTWERSQGLR